MSGRGTYGEPWDLSTALNSLIQNTGVDQSIWLKDGTYNVDATTGLTFVGSEAAPLIIKPLNQRRAKLNGSIVWRGGWCELHDLEIYDADFLTRTSAYTGSTPADIPTHDGLKADAANLKFINCVIHDCRQGILYGSGNGNLEVYGCVIYYNGWSAPDRGHGHALYASNSDSNSIVLAKHNIIFWQFGWGIHFYREGSNPMLENMQAIENICFENGQLHGYRNMDILLGGGGCWPVNGQVLRNEVYQRDFSSGIGIQLGGGLAGAESCSVQDNFVAGGQYPFAFIGDNWGANAVNGNTWIGTPFNASYFPDNTVLADYPASGSRVTVFPNEYKSDRAHVAIYNWSQADSVTVDLSAVTGLSVGDSVTVSSVQDLFVDIATLQLDANKHIVIDMRAASHTVATPQGGSAPETTFPLFGCFVVRKV